jgi:glutamate racemase
VIGTSRTVESGSYRAAIAAIDPAVEVFEKATPLLVPLIEEGWTGHPVLMMVLKEYLGGFVEKGIDTIVLGCTHYPLIRREIRESLQGDENIWVVDSADTTAGETKRILEEKGIRRSAGGTVPFTVYLTDVTRRFREVAGTILEADVVDIRSVASDYTDRGLRYVKEF